MNKNMEPKELHMGIEETAELVERMEQINPEFVTSAKECVCKKKAFVPVNGSHNPVVDLVTIVESLRLSKGFKPGKHVFHIIQKEREVTVLHKYDPERPTSVSYFERINGQYVPVAVKYGDGAVETYRQDN